MAPSKGSTPRSLVPFTPSLFLPLRTASFALRFVRRWASERYPLPYRSHLPMSRSSINRPASPYQTTDADLTRFFVGRRNRDGRSTDLNKPLPGGISHRRTHTSAVILTLVSYWRSREREPWGERRQRGAAEVN